MASVDRVSDAWRREYEPDSDPDRPAFFSNLRAAWAAWRPVFRLLRLSTRMRWRSVRSDATGVY